MAYEFLTKLFGEAKEGEEPKSMTAEELVKAIEADSGLQLVNLKDGGYVSKDKFDNKASELSGVKEQLKEANAQIESFSGKEANIEEINQKVADWESKYKTDTEALQKQLEDQAREHAEDMFFAGYDFTSKAAKNGVLAEFRAQNFTLGDDGQFRGGKEYMDSLMAQEDYAGAFKVDEPEPEPEEEAGEEGGQEEGENGQQATPYFAGHTQGSAGSEGKEGPKFDFNFTRLRQPPESK